MENSYQIGERLLKEVALLDYKPKLLLHACCAPCSTYPLSKLKDLFDITLYYNNSNIYPFQEFDRRLKELIKFLDEFNKEYSVDIKLIIPEYKNEEFNERLEYAKEEPEKGKSFTKQQKAWKTNQKKEKDASSVMHIDYKRDINTLLKTNMIFSPPL